MQVKKNLLKTIGNAKQCLLCNKVFSREKVAVCHVFQLHQDLLQSPDDKKNQVNLLEEDPNLNKTLVSSNNSTTNPESSGCWKCKFCSKYFTALEDTVPHMRLMHGVTRLDARNKSLQKIYWSSSIKYFFRRIKKYGKDFLILITGKRATVKPEKNVLNIKRDLITGVGQAKQCFLCKRIFSSEYKAVDHIYEAHQDLRWENLSWLKTVVINLEQIVLFIPRFKCYFTTR